MPETPQPVCDVCHMPAIQADGRWEHAEVADAVFCQLVMRAVSGD